jgi:hypothetical protein
MTAQTDVFTRDIFGSQAMRAGSLDEAARTASVGRREVGDVV